ncbi:MAG: siphovirus Gp157 family protein [Brachymonas sp.]|nr:siphovirus Gp157 family protein [Brachymonas sp.]
MSNTITLFDAAQDVRNSFIVDPETGEIDASYANSLAFFKAKGGNCIAYLKDEDAAIAAQEKVLEAAAKHVATRKAARDRFKGYVADSMKAAGVTKLQTADGLFTATLSPECVEAVEIDEGATFPPELCNEPRPPAPSKTKIAAAIKAGQPIKGARIVRRDRFVIR